MKRPHNVTLRSALPFDSHLLSTYLYSSNFTTNTTKLKIATPYKQKLLSAIKEIRNRKDMAKAAKHHTVYLLTLR